MIKALSFFGLLLPTICFAAHPLTTDDTGTQGTGQWQYEFNTEFATLDTAREQTWNSQLTYGLRDTLDVFISTPYQRLRSDLPDSSARGFNDPTIGLKWRIYESNGLSFGLLPSVSLPFANDRNGLGNGRATYSTRGLMQYTVGSFTWLTNVGYTRNNNVYGDRRNLFSASTAGLYRLNEKITLLADYGYSSNQDPDTSKPEGFALVGAIYSLNKKVDLDLGYKRGLNQQALNHSWMAGATLRW